MSEPISVHVPPVVYTATKAVVATITTGLGVVTLFATSISDGVLTWGEGGALIGGFLTAVATIAGVWRVPNEPKAP